MKIGSTFQRLTPVQHAVLRRIINQSGGTHNRRTLDVLVARRMIERDCAGNWYAPERIRMLFEDWEEDWLSYQRGGVRREA